MTGEVKSSFGWIELVNYSANPTDTDSTLKGLAFVSGSLKYWNGSSWASISSSGGISSLDELYDNDKTLSIDDTTWTFQVTKAGIDGLTLSGNGTASGSLLQFSNSGTGNDVDGTSNTWSVSKTGASTFASVTSGAIVGSTNLTIDATGTGTITLAGTSTGAITLTTAVTATASITITGTADSNCLTVTAGDMLMSNGKIAITNDDTDAVITATANAVTTGNAILLTANGVTSGNMLSLVTTSSGFTTGTFINCNDGSARFQVKADGATAITTGVNSTKALEITGIQTSENLVTLTTSGVTADDKAIILINSSGNSASGSNQIRIAPSGTPVEGSIGIEFVGSSKLMQALNIDGDSVDNSVVLINGGGALASTKAVLEVTNDGNLASGGNLARFTLGGTPNASAVAIQLTASKDCTALNIATSSATNSAVVITGAGAVADNKALLHVIDGGTPANVGANVARFEFTGTATNKSKILELVGASKDVSGLYCETNNTTLHAVSVIGAGALNAGRMLYVTNTGTPAGATDSVAELTFGGTATNNPIVLNVNNGTANALPLLVTSNVASATRQVASMIQDSTTGAIEVLHLKQDDDDIGFIKLEGTAGAGKSIDSDDKSGGTAVYVKIKINSTAYWIKATPGA